MAQVYQSSLLTVTVLNVLFSRQTQEIDFDFGCYSIRPSMFRDVADCIGQGKLKVLYDSSLKGEAYYDSKANTLALGFTNSNQVTKLALIVHECLHAALDFRLWNVNVLTSEALAYIAQAMYVYKAGVGVLSGGTKEEAAANLANQLINGYKIDIQDVYKLKVGIMCERKYWGASARAANFDGIA
jgi:hypothetical protein